MVNDLIFVKPEEEGLSSQWVEAFLDRMEERKINLHSFMLVRNGKILTEAYYKPFDKDFKHRLYSSSKTYVAIAIGVLIDEGKLKLEDRIADYFPEYTGENTHPWIKNATVEDALKMSAPQGWTTYADQKYDDWTWTVFNRTENVRPSGAVWQYNTAATFILDVLVERITGTSIMEYMRPLFDKIGVSKDIWCVKSPDGYSWCGSGIVCTLRDFAKFGELILNKGEYKGEQLISRAFMERATSKQIANRFQNEYSPLRCCGYGYQIWITDSGYALRGMGSQLVLCFPDKNFMFVCQADTQCAGDSTQDYIYDAVKHLLYEKLESKRIGENEQAYKKLCERLDVLSLEEVCGEDFSEREKSINGVKFTMDENPIQWKWFRFDFEKEKGTLTYENIRGIKQIKFGRNRFWRGTFPETHYADKQVGTPANRELDCIASAGWIDEDRLLLRIYVIDNFLGNCFMTFGFNGKETAIRMVKAAEFFLNEYAGCAGGRRE